MSESVEQAQRRYTVALHAMQTGVLMEMEIDSGPTAPTSPKHLRVGVNSAMLEHGALMKLLVDKGIVTWEEYYTSLADRHEEEVQRYQERLSMHFGRPVTLR